MSENATPRTVPPHPRNGLPRVASVHPTGEGRPAYDWDAIVPQLMDALAAGDTVTSAAETLGIPRSDAYRLVTSDAWAAQFSDARRAGAMARADRAQQRLDALADQEAAPDRTRIDAARWSAWHAQWWAERGDSERWGREDRLKVQSVSAVRVIVETPPVTAQLPAAQEVTARVLSTQEARALTEGAAARVDTTQPVRVEEPTQP